MFGISLGKLVVLAAILIGVWQIFRIFQSKASTPRRSNGAGGQPPEHSTTQESDPEPAAVETTACPVCGAYQPSEGASACGRGDCPFLS